MRSVGNLLDDPRKRVDDRGLEKEEEEYFNEDRYAFTYLHVNMFNMVFTEYVYCSVTRKILPLHLRLMQVESSLNRPCLMDLLQASHL